MHLITTNTNNTDSQGQSLSKVAIYLPNPCFSHGQLYVGLSRSGSPENTKIMIEASLTSKAQGLTKSGIVYTQNIVWQEALSNTID